MPTVIDPIPRLDRVENLLQWARQLVDRLQFLLGRKVSLGQGTAPVVLPHGLLVKGRVDAQAFAAARFADGNYTYPNTWDEFRGVVWVNGGAEDINPWRVKARADVDTWNQISFVAYTVVGAEIYVEIQVFANNQWSICTGGQGYQRANCSVLWPTIRGSVFRGLVFVAGGGRLSHGVLSIHSVGRIT